MRQSLSVVLPGRSAVAVAGWDELLAPDEAEMLAHGVPPRVDAWLPDDRQWLAGMIV
jgi:hypothetical protein